MSLDKHEAVPVDTHVWRIACRDFGFKGKLSLKTSQQVAKHFQQVFGDFSGWAQAVRAIRCLFRFYLLLSCLKSGDMRHSILFIVACALKGTFHQK